MLTVDGPDSPAADRTMGNDSLFRQEAIDARATRQLGTIRLAQPLGHRVAASLAIGVIGVVAAVAVVGTYTRHASVPGLLEPVGGTLRVMTAVAGIVTEVRAVEGRPVARGDVLFVISGERWSPTGETNGSIARQLDGRSLALDGATRLVAERDVLRSRSAHERLVAIDRELAQLAHETAINATRRDLAQRNVERFESLARTGFVAPVQSQAKQDELLVLQAAGDGYARLRTGLDRERAGLASQLGDSRLQADAERAEIERQRASLAQERAEHDARRATIVVAPRDGVATGITARVGQLLSAGALLATLIPDDAALEAQLFATTRQAGFVEPGQRVRLRYAAYPYQKFGVGEGVVASIERSPYAPQELPGQVAGALAATGLIGAEPVYRVMVTLDRQTIRTYGLEHALRAGMVFDADILQDRRRLIEWWLEPLYGVAGR